MTEWRRIAGALCIVVAMVLGAFAGFVYARPGAVGVSPDAGTRGEDRRLLSASDEMQKLLDPDQGVVAESSLTGPTSITEQTPEIVSPDGAIARPVSLDEEREAVRLSTSHFEGKDGTVTIKPAEPKTGTRGHLSGGFDAGGPYGGPDTFEGTDLTIEVTVYDPQIIFFRYDFENDGIFDYPDQTGAGSLGRWTTQTLVTRTFNDNVFGEVLVEGWDGISTTIEINGGDNLGEVQNFQWFIGYGGWNFAWKFRPKGDLTISELGHYHYVYPVYDMGLWDSGGNLLGSCEAVHNFFEWNWCTLPSSVDVFVGQEYYVSLRTTEWTTAIDTPQDTDFVEFQGTYYCWGPSSLCFPDSFWVDFFIPQIDFRWTQVLVLPDAAQDTAQIEVNNVAPTVFDPVTNPDPGLEGTPTEFSAFFEDPGLDDTWEYRWIFHDGEVSDWQPVTKFSGGAKVLVLHSWTGDATGFESDLREACGNFCIAVDDFDFGPLGQNRVPSLAELQKYDVLVIGTNWGPIPGPDAMGDRLAEYMDAAGGTGGGVIMMFAAFASTNIWGIGGRWQDEGYSPVGRSGFAFFDAELGSIYVPGHPILDGVSTFSSWIRHDEFDVTDGAERVADWTDGRVSIATKENPVAGNGAQAVALPFFPMSWSAGGDYLRLISNAIRFASRADDPVLKTMPIQLDPFQKAFRDDDPTTTTPQDTFPVTVEVRDDDHGKLKIVAQDELSFNDFDSPSECSGYWGGTSNWPAGWFADPDGYGWVCGDSDWLFGSRGPDIWYYYNDPNYGTGDGTSNLYTNSFDLSAYSGVKVEFYTWWQADYPFGTSDGFVEASVDGGATWDVVLTEYHHNDPAMFQGDYVTETTLVGGYSDVMFRFRYESNDDWWWFVDNFRVTGVVGEVMEGLGSAEGTATIANVAPTVIGGFDSALRDEAQALEFKGFKIDDPALLEPTEWFAYAWDFDDGTPVEWTYKGSLAPPKLDVFVIQTLCLSGNSCGEYRQLEDTLLAQDDVGSVTPFNFINYPFLPTAPTLNTMLQYDVIVVATNWAYISYQPFDLARRQVGDRLAQYIDAGRGGVVTVMAVYDLSAFYGDIFSINGRYMDDDYGPFERLEYLFGGGVLGTIHDPEHDLFVGVASGGVESAFIHSGDYKVSRGGRNNAAGADGVLLADWTDGNSAVGVKELNNGMRTVHVGMFGMPQGSQSGMLWRNALGWASGGIPSPKIPAFTHTFGDNGVYTIDLMAIDDDMGYEWDFGANEPMAVLDTEISHRLVEVAVDNVEPTIVPKSGTGGGIEAFIATQVCIRISGQAGNSVTADVYEDGVLAASVTATRESGSPNPETEKCGLLKVDVLAAHDYSVDLTYSRPNGGSNPTWLIFSPWRDPVSPGHGTISQKYDFSAAGTISVDLPNLKRALVDSGLGAKIDFSAEAYDPGTDDLAFLWAWGTEDSVPYEISSLSVYTIHVYHNSGDTRTDGALETPQFLGFSEPYFDRDANDERSPMGTMDFRVRDTAVHAFSGGQDLYYVFLLVLDDDNSRGYPSTFLHDGIDVEFLVVDLR